MGLRVISRAELSMHAVKDQTEVKDQGLNH